MYDYILRGGMVVDGTGQPAIKADVAIKDGKIAEIGANITGQAKEVIDVTCLAVAPGFIDIHSHSDTAFLQDERCESKIYQGVTTELAGQCGSTIYPCPEIAWRTYATLPAAGSKILLPAPSKNSWIRCNNKGRR